MEEGDERFRRTRSWSEALGLPNSPPPPYCPFRSSFPRFSEEGRVRGRTVPAVRCRRAPLRALDIDRLLSAPDRGAVRPIGVVGVRQEGRSVQARDLHRRPWPAGPLGVGRDIRDAAEAVERRNRAPLGHESAPHTARLGIRWTLRTSPRRSQTGCTSARTTSPKRASGEARGISTPADVLADRIDP
jgi:hypothetical protein